jgi:hypothetical protein
VRIGSQLEEVAGFRVEPRDFASGPLGSPFADGVLAGIGSLANPFAVFADALPSWPTAGLIRDWSAISHDFWTAVGDYTDDTAETTHPPRLFDPDVVVR